MIKLKKQQQKTIALTTETVPLIINFHIILKQPLLKLIQVMLRHKIKQNSIIIAQVVLV